MKYKFDPLAEHNAGFTYKLDSQATPATVLFMAWKHDAKETALPHYALQLNLSVVGFNCPASDGKSQASAAIITSELEAKRMTDRAGMLGPMNETLLGLKPGSIEIPGPLVVHIPKDKAVYAGDILYSGCLLAVIGGGNVESWIVAVARACVRRHCI